MSGNLALASMFPEASRLPSQPSSRLTENLAFVAQAEGTRAPAAFRMSASEMSVWYPYQLFQPSGGVAFTIIPWILAFLGFRDARRAKRENPDRSVHILTKDEEEEWLRFW